MRLQPTSSLLAVVDIQERLLPAIPAAAVVVERATRLARAAAILGVPAVLTEQYPKGLGATPTDLAALLPPARTKMSFSCCGCEDFEKLVATADRGPLRSVVLCGFETHVCIAQTALDLLARGLMVFVAVDAVGSRHAIDHDAALRRLEAAGAFPTTSEAILFEWCQTADNPQFQAIRRLVL
jgi:nicotinamidase-related amidase